MPRLHPIFTNFTTGEASPVLFGRVDIAKYLNACATLLNFLVQPQGGAIRRPGTRFVKAVKTESSLTILLPFEYSVTQAYILEVGASYIRFYRNNARIESGGTPVEVSTPYTASDLRNLDVRQVGDVLYFMHASYATRKLERYSDTLWKFRVVDWTPPPTFEYGARPVSEITPAAVSGENITFTASAAVDDTFFPSDVGREILIIGGANAGARAGIKTYSSGTQVVCNICDAWVNLTATGCNLWKITGSPQTTATVAAKSPVGVSTTVTLGAAGWRGVNTDSSEAVSSDCGRYAVVNGGQFEITAITSSTVAQAVIRGEASATTAANAGAWTLEEELWSSCNGFAETGDFFEDRFWLNAGYRFCGSKTGDYENFGVGVLDDDAVVFATRTQDPIRAIIGAKALFILTSNAEFVAKGGTDSPITPSNVQVSNETTYGSAKVPPLRIGNIVAFLTRSGKKLRELAYNFDVDGYVAPDLLLLSEHLTSSCSVVDHTYQREPDSRIWGVRGDGVGLACTYLRDQNIVAWSRMTTGSCDAFESLATIPHPDGDRDQVWAVVRRTVNGATHRYVEFFDDSTLTYDRRHTDACVVYDGSCATTMTGLDHLECSSVVVLGDGAVYPGATVAGGSITLSGPAAYKIEVGLPYTSTLETVTPEVQSGAGASMPLRRRWAEAFVRIYNSLGLTVNGDQIPFRTSKDVFGCAPALVSMDVRLPNLGYDCGRVTVQQTQPLPCNILAISGTLDLGGG